MAEEFKMILQRVFNNWMALRLAVENGMGGRNGQKTAMEMMDYVHQYCTLNENITQSELEGVIEDILDQEFNTVCEDNSVNEISSILLKCLQLLKINNIEGLKENFSKMPSKEQWLVPNAVLQINVSDSESDDEDDSDSEMEVDEEMSAGKSKEKPIDDFVEPEEGWTTVRKKK